MPRVARRAKSCAVVVLCCFVLCAGLAPVACYGHRSNAMPASLLLHAVARFRRVWMCSRRLLATGYRSHGLPASLPLHAEALLPLLCMFDASGVVVMRLSGVTRGRGRPPGTA